MHKSCLPKSLFPNPRHLYLFKSSLILVTWWPSIKDSHNFRVEIIARKYQRQNNFKPHQELCLICKSALCISNVV